MATVPIKTSIRYFILAIVVLGILWGLTSSDNGFLLSTDADRPVGTNIGDLAPEIKGTSLDGQEIRLTDQRGKVVLINAFASWCGPCRAETPDLVDFQQANQDKVTLIGLNIGENEAAIASFQQEFGVPYPLVVDAEGKIAQTYHPLGLPTSWFIDGQGIVQYVHTGPMTGDLLEQILGEILSLEQSATGVSRLN